MHLDNHLKLGKFVVLSIMVPHVPALGSGGMPPTILMSVRERFGK